MTNMERIQRNIRTFIRTTETFRVGISILEFKYRHLRRIPDFKAATHGARPEDIVQFLRAGEIPPVYEEIKSLSLDQTVWAYPKYVYLVFPFHSIKPFVGPTFYLRIKSFPIPVNNFAICSWGAIPLTELMVKLGARIPVDLATYIVVPLPNPDVQRAAAERGIPTVERYEITELARWAEDARKFVLEYMEIIPDFNTLQNYLPQFVRNYNAKLANIFGIPEEEVYRAEKEQMEFEKV